MYLSKTKNGLPSGDEYQERTYHCWPDASNGHSSSSSFPWPDQPLSLQVHGEPLGQDAHGDFAHGVGRLAAEEAAVDGRADDDDAAPAAAGAQVRQGGVDGGVEALDVDLLQEAEAPRGRVLDRGPPDGAGVVDEDVEVVVFLFFMCKHNNKKMFFSRTDSHGQSAE